MTLKLSFAHTARIRTGADSCRLARGQTAIKLTKKEELFPVSFRITRKTSRSLCFTLYVCVSGCDRRGRGGDESSLKEQEVLLPGSWANTPSLKKR